MKVGIWEFGLLQKKFACEKIWVVGCMHCPVGGAKGTRCDSAMGGEVWRSRIFQRLGPGGVCHLTLSKHTDQDNIVFYFFCLFVLMEVRLHPSIHPFSLILLSPGTQGRRRCWSPSQLSTAKDGVGWEICLSSIKLHKNKIARLQSLM